MKRFLAAAAVVALALSPSLTGLAHEHPDKFDSQCRVCNAFGPETAAPPDAFQVAAPPEETEVRSDVARPDPDAPAVAPGSPRAPPA